MAANTRTARSLINLSNRVFTLLRSSTSTLQTNGMSAISRQEGTENGERDRYPEQQRLGPKSSRHIGKQAESSEYGRDQNHACQDELGGTL